MRHHQPDEADARRSAPRSRRRSARPGRPSSASCARPRKPRWLRLGLAQQQRVQVPRELHQHAGSQPGSAGRPPSSRSQVTPLRLPSIQKLRSRSSCLRAEEDQQADAGRRHGVDARRRPAAGSATSVRPSRVATAIDDDGREPARRGRPPAARRGAAASAGRYSASVPAQHDEGRGRRAPRRSRRRPGRDRPADCGTAPAGSTPATARPAPVRMPSAMRGRRMSIRIVRSARALSSAGLRPSCSARI